MELQQWAERTISGRLLVKFQGRYDRNIITFNHLQCCMACVIGYLNLSRLEPKN